MTFLSAFLLISFLSPRFVIGDGNGDWGYRKGNYLTPEKWKTVYRACGGNRQSPINIDSSYCTYWNYLKPVNINTLQGRPDVSLKKSDTTLYLKFSQRWIINFGDKTCLRPVSIHWHWGSTSVQGSEHRIQNVKYPIEGHLITYNCNLYNNSDEATTSSSGLHVFGILYKIGAENPVLKEMLSMLNKMDSTNSVNIPEIYPRNLFPKDVAKYFRYEGSLTVPPCRENVIWTVFNEIQTLSESQMNRFRSLMYGKPESGKMVDNFRPILFMNSSSEYIKRVVYSSFNYGMKAVEPLPIITLSIAFIEMIIFRGIC